MIRVEKQIDVLSIPSEDEVRTYLMNNLQIFPSRVARHWPWMPLVLTRSDPATKVQF